MRVAIIADTHRRGGLAVPDRCLEELLAAELILHAGDLVSEMLLDELQALGPPVAAVLGNVDEQGLAERLPVEQTVTAGTARIGLVHDAGPAKGRLARLRRRFPEADAVVFGHSHVPLHERDGAFQIFNPGSPTDRRRQPAHTMGVADVGDGVEFTLLEL